MSVAPTLPTSCGSLPPGGAELAWGGPALRSRAPTLVASRTTLHPRGLFRLGAARRRNCPPRSPLPVVCCPPRGLALLGAARRGGLFLEK